MDSMCLRKYSPTSRTYGLEESDEPILLMLKTRSPMPDSSAIAFATMMRSASAIALDGPTTCSSSDIDAGEEVLASVRHASNVSSLCATGRAVPGPADTG